MIKVGMVGTGFIAEVHANSYKHIKNARLTAVTDTIKDKGSRFAIDHRASFYNNLDELLENKDVDIIDICAPTCMHAEIAIKSANAGKNIFCEKPMALCLEDADKMIKAVEQNNVKAMVGHVLRFWPEYIKAKEIIESGQLGKPLHISCLRLASLPDWFEVGMDFNEKNNGGVSIDLHIHDLDYLIWLFGKPVSVNSQGAFDNNSDGLWHIVSNIEFGNGNYATAEAAWVHRGSFPFTTVLRILCEEGSVEWIFRSGKNIEKRSDKAELIVYKSDGSIERPEIRSDDPYLVELRYFIDCMENDREIKITSLEEARDSLELALAATKSAREKTTILI